jgi:CRISPR-associated protein Cas1
MYAGGLGPSRGSGLLMRQAYLVTRTQQRLAVARRMYGMRFPDDDVSGATMQQLRGREGARIKKIYRAHADRTGVSWNRRIYTPGEPSADGDDINRLLSAGHSCLYGICHAAIIGIGASPALGFVHTGSAVSFVLDIADLYKADYTIPLAFDLAAAGTTEERDIRTAFRDKVADGHLMGRIVRDIKDLLLDDKQTDTDDHDGLHLWDELDGQVPGGVNWAADYANGWDDAISLGIIGPDTDDQPTPG